jgi:hypothetical protein
MDSLAELLVLSGTICASFLVALLAGWLCLKAFLSALKAEHERGG